MSDATGSEAAELDEARALCDRRVENRRRGAGGECGVLAPRGIVAWAVGTAQDPIARDVTGDAMPCVFTDERSVGRSTKRAIGDEVTLARSSFLGRIHHHPKR